MSSSCQMMYSNDYSFALTKNAELLKGLPKKEKKSASLKKSSSLDFKRCYERNSVECYRNNRALTGKKKCKCLTWKRQLRTNALLNCMYDASYCIIVLYFYIIPFPTVCFHSSLCYNSYFQQVVTLSLVIMAKNGVGNFSFVIHLMVSRTNWKC